MKYLRKTLYVLPVLFGGLIFTSPYIAILDFKTAIETNDMNKYNSYINFPSVRNSLKPQINLAVREAISSKLNSSSFSAFGLLFIEPVVNRLVDSAVTPNGLKLLLDKGTISQSMTNEPSKKTEVKSEKTENKQSKNKNIIKLFYLNPNVFVLSSQSGDLQEPIKAIWVRSGFFNWKLNSLSIPPTLLNLN